MDAFDQFGLRDVEKVVVPLQFGGMILKLSAISGFIELEGLDHRPHGSIQDEDAVLEKSPDFLCYVSEVLHAA